MNFCDYIGNRFVFVKENLNYVVKIVVWNYLSFLFWFVKIIFVLIFRYNYSIYGNMIIICFYIM